MAQQSGDSFIEWDDERYSTDIDRFDAQHRHLFGLLNDLHTAMDEGHSEERVGDILRELEAYTEYHFGDEEEFMQDCGYAMDCADCFYNHRDAHEEFARKVTELREKHENGEYITMEVLLFARDWLDSHIGGADVDQSYSEYFRRAAPDDYEYTPGKLNKARETDATDPGHGDLRQDPDPTPAGGVVDGPALDVPEEPLAAWFDGVVARHADRTATVTPGDRTRTVGELADRARSVAAGLLSAGLEPGDRVGIHAESGPAWSVVDLACPYAGLVSVPVAPTVAEDRALSLAAGADLDAAVTDAATDDPVAAAADQVFGLSTFPTGEADALPGTDASPSDPGTVVYDLDADDPSGYVLTHRALRTAVASLAATVPLDAGATGSCMLPLAHPLQRLATYACWDAGGRTAYLDPDSLVADLSAVDPTLLVGVPALYERLYTALQARLEDLGGMRGRLVGDDPAAVVTDDGSGLTDAAADRLVVQPLTDSLGLGALRYAVSTAGVAPAVRQFFGGCDLPLVEVAGVPAVAGLGCRRDADGTAPMPGTRAAVGSDGRLLLGGATLADRALRPDPALGSDWYRTDRAASVEAGAVSLDDRR